MSVRIVDVGGTATAVAMDESVVDARREWAVLQVRATDELSNASVGVPVQIGTSRPGLAARSAAGGLAALVAVPATAFPRLRTQAYTIPYAISAAGYLAVTGEAQLPSDGSFPDRFVPLRIGPLALHRLPVTLAGRVSRRGSGDPVAGASVQVVEIWPVQPPADGSVAPIAPNLVAVHPPLRAARTTGSGRVRRRNVTPVPGEDKVLLDEAPAGASALHLSDAVGLAVGGTLLLDADPALQELVTILALEPVGATSLPARVTTTHALSLRHRRGATVRRVSLLAPGAQRLFGRAAIAGDSTLFLDSLSGITSATTLEVFGGPAVSELHMVRRYVATTDADGRFTLPPLSRVAQLTLRVVAGALTKDVTVVPHYARLEHALDITL